MDPPGSVRSPELTRRALSLPDGFRAFALKVSVIDLAVGLFLGEVVDSLLLSLALFLFIVKFLGWLLRLRKEEVATARR